uniref:Uncharacterized protein n=1 Tax=Cucumis sativus TaxID=3659 RepID=A0A0A0KGS4_CUCSA
MERSCPCKSISISLGESSGSNALSRLSISWYSNGYSSLCSGTSWSMSFFRNLRIFFFIHGIGANKSKDMPKKVLVIRKATDERHDLERNDELMYSSILLQSSLSK